LSCGATKWSQLGKQDKGAIDMGNFSLLAKLGLDSSSFESGAKRAESLSRKFGKEMTGALATAFSVEKVVEFGLEAVSAAGKLSDLSERTGVSAQFLQEMKFAAEQTGASLEDVTASVEKLNVARSQALAGSEAKMDAFKLLGISAEDLKTLKSDDLFTKIGETIKNAPNPQNLLAPFREIAGKGAGALIPAMIEGLQETAQKARELGLVMNDNVVASLDDAADRIDTLKAGFTVLVGAIISEGGGQLFKFFEALGSAAQTFFTMVFNPKTNTDNNPFSRLKFLIEQSREAFKASIDEQNQASVEKADQKQKRAEQRKTFNPAGLEIEDATVTTDQKLAKVASNTSLGQNADSFAKIGLFGGFQSSQDRMIKELQTQANYLKYIQRASEKTADAVGQ
jgi:hypothetical protein